MAWDRADEYAPDHGGDADHPLIIDLDETLLDMRSGKEHAAPTFKKGFGLHPLDSWVDHGPVGIGEPLVATRDSRDFP